MSDLKAMGLYRNVDRIAADLQAAGIDHEAALRVEDLTAYDQYHYEGTQAVDDACGALSARAGRRILDIGSGLGGPARYIAHTTEAAVTALELQPDLHHTAAALTDRCGLSSLVTHVNGDVLAGAVAPNSFDGIVSMLCFLHIEDRASLFARCAEALVPAGEIFIDDYVARAPLTAEESDALAKKVSCPFVPSLEDYVGHLTDAGFRDVSVTDKTEEWARFVADRYEAFVARRNELEQRYGEQTVAGLDDFYGTVASIFAGGRLGGLRLVARLPG